MANVTVTSSNPAISVTKSNSVVNVASTSSTVTVSAIASLANANVVRSQVSATDAGGDGSFAYDSSTGVFTYTGPSAAEVRAHFSATSPVTLASGVIGIDESALFTGKTTDDLTEGSTNLYYTTDRANTAIGAYTGALTNLTGDITTTGIVTAGTSVTDTHTFTGNLNVTGNVEVSGNLDYRNVEDLYVRDQSITLNANAATDATIQIIANRPQTQNTALRWNEPTDTWQFSNDGSTYVDFLGPSSTRALFSAGGDLSYNSSTGEFSYTRGPGDIEGVIAGDGLSGGGTSGTVTLNVDSTVVRTTGTQSIAGAKTFSDTTTFDNTTDFNDTMTVQDITGNGGTLANTKVVFPADQSNAIIRYQGTTGGLTIDSFSNVIIHSDKDNTGGGDLILRSRVGGSEADVFKYDRNTGNVILGGSSYVFTGGLGTVGGNVYHTGTTTNWWLEPLIGSNGHWIGDIGYNESDSVGLLGKLSYSNNFFRLNNGTPGSSRYMLSGSGAGQIVYDNQNVGSATNTLTITKGNPSATHSNVLVIDNDANATFIGNVIASVYHGDGSQLTNLPADAVTSVNGLTGVVVLDTGDLQENGNLFYTDARSRAAVSVSTAAASGDGSLSYNDGTGVFTFTPADAGLSDYGNVQVTNFLQNGYGSNTITTTGNISAGNVNATNKITQAETRTELIYSVGNTMVLGTETGTPVAFGTNVTIRPGKFSGFDSGTRLVVGDDSNCPYLTFQTGHQSESLAVGGRLSVDQSLDLGGRYLYVGADQYKGFSTYQNDTTPGNVSIQFGVANANIAGDQTKSTFAGIRASRDTRDGVRDYSMKMGWFDPIPEDEPNFDTGATNWIPFSDLADTKVDTTFDANLTVSGNLIATNPILADVDGAVLLDVYNDTGGTLNKGDAVYLTGANTGDNPHVNLTENNDATKMPAIGIVKENISTGFVGQVVTSGVMNDSSHGYTLGADLYINTTAGTLTTTKPTGEDKFIQKIGKVVSTNHILVQGAFRSNQVSNLNSGNIFIGNGSNEAVTADFTDTANAAIADYSGNLDNLTGDVTTTAKISQAQTRTELIYSTGNTLTLGTETGSPVAFGTDITIVPGYFSGFDSGTRLVIGDDSNAPYLNFLGGHQSESLAVGGRLSVDQSLDLGGRYLYLGADQDDGFSTYNADTTPANVRINFGLGAIDIVDAPDLVDGVEYRIETTGTTDFTLVGAADSDPNTRFTADLSGGAATGTGTVAGSEVGSIVASRKDRDGVLDYSMKMGWVDNVVSNAGANYDSGAFIPFSDLADTKVDTTFDANITVSGHTHLTAFSETVVALGSQSGDLATLPALNASNASIFTVTATGGITLNSIPNATAGSSYTIKITQDGTGSHALTSSFKYQGGNKTLSTGPNDIDVISVVYDGTDYLATLTLDYS